MTATIDGFDKPIRVVENCFRYYVYKDQNELVTPGTELVWKEGSGEEKGKFELKDSPFELIALESADDLGKRTIDLRSPEFAWYQELKRSVVPATGRPWVIVAMGTPAIGKTTFMMKAKPDQQAAINTALGADANVPFGNVFYKQLDNIVAAGARSEFRTLYSIANSIQDPRQRFRAFWANKQALFTRYAVDKPSAVAGEDSPQSYEFRVGEAMVKDLTAPHQPYNIGMETTGLSPALVKFGLSAPCYANYHKLVLFFDFTDEDGWMQAVEMAHSRLVEELNKQVNLGGEQHSQYLRVIARKACETYKTCQELAASKNAELDASGSAGGRWFCHRVEQNLTPAAHHGERITKFYEGVNYDAESGATPRRVYIRAHHEG